MESINRTSKTELNPNENQIKELKKLQQYDRTVDSFFWCVNLFDGNIVSDGCTCQLTSVVGQEGDGQVCFRSVLITCSLSGRHAVLTFETVEHQRVSSSNCPETDLKLLWICGLAEGI